MDNQKSNLHKNILLFFFVLCGLEGIACFFWLATLPVDQKNAVFFGFSLQRLMILGVIAIFIIIFLLFWYLAQRSYKKLITLINSLIFSKWIGWVNLFLCIGGIFLFSIIVFPPPSIMPFGSALYQRMLPILSFAVLCTLQTIIIILIFAWQEIKRWLDVILINFRKITASQTLCYGLLIFSAIVATTQVYYVYYNLGDEGDTITVGWLISKGWVLYKDVFSHHFPFPYLFTALVIKIFGASILPVRLSIIILRTLCIALAMKISNFRFPLSIMAVCWSLVGHLYLGNSLVYHSFSGIFIICAIAIGLAYVENIQKVSAMGLFIFSIFCGLTSLCDPLKSLPAIALIIFMIISTILQNPREMRLRQAIRISLILFLGGCLTLGAYLLYATITNSLADFYQNAILFNTTIYSKYSPSITIKNILQSLTNCLGIGNQTWFENYSPYYQWRNYLFVDHWIFTGFFYRLVILASCIFCLINRKFLFGVCLYIVSSLLTIRSSVCFSASPFILLSFFISALIISDSFFSIQNQINILFRNSMKIFNVSTRVIILLMFIWLNIRGAEFLLHEPTKLTYFNNFNGIIGDAAYYKKISCYNNDVKLLIYSSPSITYFFAQMYPASKFIFMTPWVAEVGQKDAIKALTENPSILYIDRKTNVWNYPVDEFLADLLNYVDQQYIPLKEKNIYISKDLQVCY